MVCHWKVRIWDKDGKASAWSAPAGWSMGLLKPEDWLDAQDPATGKSAQFAPKNDDPSCWFLWGAMVDVMPWKAYNYYGDRRLLEQAYDAMVRYPAKYIDNFFAGGGIQRNGGDGGRQSG
jgi:hypothetical protein